MLLYQIWIMVIVIVRGICKELYEYDMISMCGRTVRLRNNKDGRVYFHQNGSNISSCAFTLKNSLYSYYEQFDQIAFQFTEFSGSGLGCIQIGQYYLVDFVIDPIRDLETSYCNGTFPDLNTIYTTSFMRTMFIKFESQFNGNTSFEFVFNAFIVPYGNCNSLYQCDNRRCISNDVNCNGHNPCGDNSDCQIREEKREETTITNDNNEVYYNDFPEENGQSRNIGIGGIIFVFIIVILAYCICLRRRRQPERVVIELPNQPFIANLSASRNVPNLTRPIPLQGASPQDHYICRSLIVTTHNDEPQDYSTQALTDLPPSYEDVIKDEQKYKLTTNIENVDS